MPSPPPITQAATIEIRGARTHNLKGIDVSIPHGALTVVTGVSGSGKSSLVFHTLFAEGHFRFLNTLAGQSAPFISRLPRGQVDSITGIAPMLAIPQTRPRASNRSTVATLSEILDYLRLLYARKGQAHCPDCRRPVSAQTQDEIVRRILEQPEKSKIQLLAPVIRHQKGNHEETLKRISREGYVRIRLNGQMEEISELNPLVPAKFHTIEVVVDRLRVKPGIEQRLTDSVEQALRLGEGACLVLVESPDDSSELLFHRDLNCPECGRGLPTLEPQSFSWNGGLGACWQCEGSGVEPHRQSEVKEVCHQCNGARLNDVSRAVTVGDLSLPELVLLSATETRGWLQKYSEAQKNDDVLGPIIPPLLERLSLIERLGIGYLSLDRTTATLSAGEIQRVRLAKCLATELQGCCFVLDEPTAGLHAKDVTRLREILRELAAAGHTVICVEHHLELVKEADYLIEMGVSGGTLGGEVLLQGTLQELLSCPELPTTQALQCLESAEPQVRVRDVTQHDMMTFQKMSAHNLQAASIKIPYQALTVLSGVSGSGKSSLIHFGVVPLLEQAIAKESSSIKSKKYGTFHTDGPLLNPMVVDQSPPSQSARSCPATVSGAWDHIRKILAKTRTAKLRGYSAARFSFNTANGTCRHCDGRGEVEANHPFAAQPWQTCPHCNGNRFNAQTLSVRYQDRSAADLLNMTIEEAIEFWSEFSMIRDTLLPLQEVGIGYLKMGQSTQALSGGERQRLRLANFLNPKTEPHCLFLDEPTSGLHWSDVNRLITIFKKLIEQRQTIVLIEHHPLLQQIADWNIALGPGAGPEGGTVLHCGPDLLG